MDAGAKARLVLRDLRGAEVPFFQRDLCVCADYSLRCCTTLTLLSPSHVLRQPAKSYSLPWVICNCNVTFWPAAKWTICPFAS